MSPTLPQQSGSLSCHPYCCSVPLEHHSFVSLTLTFFTTPFLQVCDDCFRFFPNSHLYIYLCMYSNELKMHLRTQKPSLSSRAAEWLPCVTDDEWFKAHKLWLPFLKAAVKLKANYKKLWAAVYGLFDYSDLQLPNPVALFLKVTISTLIKNPKCPTKHSIWFWERTTP